MFNKKKKNKTEYEIDLSPELYDDNDIVYRDIKEQIMNCETLLDILDVIKIKYLGPNCNTVEDLMMRDNDNILYNNFIETFINIGIDNCLKKSPLMSVKNRIFRVDVDNVRKHNNYVAGYVRENDKSTNYETIPLNVFSDTFMINNSIKKLRLDMFMESLMNIGKQFAYEKFVRNFIDNIEPYRKYKYNNVESVRECIRVALFHNIDTIILSEPMFINLTLNRDMWYEVKKNHILLPNGTKVYSSGRDETIQAYAFNSNNVYITIGDYTMIEPTKKQSDNFKQYELVGYMSKPFISGDVCVIG